MTREEQIAECEKRLLEALSTSDIKVLDELLYDNLIFNIPSGQTITKLIEIENHQSGNLIISNILASEQIINSISEIATVAVTLDLKAKYAEQIIEGKFRYLRVWKLFGNSWKVVAGSGCPILDCG